MSTASYGGTVRSGGDGVPRKGGLGLIAVHLVVQCAGIMDFGFFAFNRRELADLGFNG